MRWSWQNSSRATMGTPARALARSGALWLGAWSAFCIGGFLVLCKGVAGRFFHSALIVKGATRMVNLTGSPLCVLHHLH